MTVETPTIELNPIPLSQLREREHAVMHVVDLNQDEGDALVALGMHDDAIFELCQQGQPCIIQIEATRLGLSRELTSRIMVRRCAVCN